MRSSKRTVRRVSLTATALTAGLAGVAIVGVATGMVSIGSWVQGDDAPAGLIGKLGRGSVLTSLTVAPRGV